MSSASIEEKEIPVLRSLPTDEVRRMMWRFAGRPDLQGLVQSARSVARGLVARLVAQGARDSQQWRDAARSLLDAFDQAGITARLAPPDQDGAAAGASNLALALAAFELAWVDGGAAACCLAGTAALELIIKRGTPEQKRRYLSRCTRPEPGEHRKVPRGALCLSEPVSSGGARRETPRGKVRVAAWEEGHEPILEVDKRGRLTAHMEFADFVLAAVASEDRRLQGTCLVLLEEGDEGQYDRGAAARKLVQQLASARDPVFKITVPASRIVGGYTIKEGVIVPNFTHEEILDAVRARTQVASAAMSAARLLSAVEPILRRWRAHRTDDAAGSSTARERGWPMPADALSRLVDVWAAGEAASSLGFAAARHLDELGQLKRAADQLRAAEGAKTTDPLIVGSDAERLALQYLELAAAADDQPDDARSADLKANKLVQYLIKQSVARVLWPAASLWNNGHGPAFLRQAVELMGREAIVATCPGFLSQKLLDAQLAAFEQPESAPWQPLIAAMTSRLFLAQFRQWIGQMRRIASSRPGTGACTVASAMDLWHWTLEHLREVEDEQSRPISCGAWHGAAGPLADALGWLLAVRCQILDVFELESQGGADPRLAETFPGCMQLLTDLCHVQAARAAGEVGRICAELVFGYKRHPSWDGRGCISGEQVDDLEAVIPGIAYGVRLGGDVVEADGSHAEKAGPCVRFEGLEGFTSRRSKLDGCLTGARLARDRAARALRQIEIPAGLDYPR